MNGENMEDIIGFESLYQSMMKCKSGVMWKGSAAHFVLNSAEEVYKLSNQLKNGTYKPRAPSKFMIYSPKQREIVSISFRDRVYQRSLNDNGIYAGMTRSFIEDNQACQIGKGTDRARDRLTELLRRAYRKYGKDVYILQCDIHGYYKHMRHDVTESLFRSKLSQEVADMAIQVMHEQYTDEHGYNPGSQMIQIAGISYLDKIDHYIKERLRVKLYERYMDDFLLIHGDYDFLLYCKSEIEKKLHEIGLTFNPKKTQIVKATDGVMFLGFTFKLTDTGKVIRLINSENVKRERKKLVRMVHKSKSGKLTRKKVDECFQAWKAHAVKGNTYKVIQRMNAFYKALWEDDDDSIQTCDRSEGTQRAGKTACTGISQQGDSGLQHHDGNP